MGAPTATASMSPKVAYSGSFIGNITNAGTISSYDTGLYVQSDGGSGFTGNIGNTGGTIVSTDRQWHFR